MISRPLRALVALAIVPACRSERYVSQSLAGALGDGALEGASCPRRGALRQLAACVVGVVAHSGRAIGDSAIGDSAVEELLGSMDADGDGAVSLEEWRAVVRPACCALAADAKGLGDEGVAGDLRRPDAEGLADVAGNGLASDVLADCGAAGDGLEPDCAAGGDELLDAKLGFFERLFAASDVDGDKLLQPRELGYMACLSTEAQKWFSVGRELEAFKAYDFDEHAVLERHAQYDADGDGAVTWFEFVAAVRECLPEVEWDGVDLETTRWLLGIYGIADVNGDGVLGPRELDLALCLVQDAASSFKGPIGAQFLLSQMFRRLDGDHDGRISALEVWRGKEAAPEDATMERIRRLFASADVDRDGALDRDEAASLAWRIAEERWA